MSYKSFPPVTSFLLDVFPVATYRIVRLHRPPPATVVDLACGPSSWTLWLEKVGGYRVTRCDISPRARLNLRADFRSPPLRDGAFDVVMADLPFPFYRGDRYGGLESVKDYVSLLRELARTAKSLLRDRGVLLVKTSDFWHSREMVPGMWLVHRVLRKSYVARDIVCLIIKPFLFSPGRFRRALRVHNYVMVYGLK